MRGLAVLSVLLFHAAARILPGGFVGVDIFFVISGYLITRSIVTELDMGTFSIARFYRKRIRRLAPALFVTVGITTVVCASLLPPRDVLLMGKSLIGLSVNASNVEFFRESGYFGAAQSAKPFLHTWSLAVEEQFYLLFPVILATCRRSRVKHITKVVLFLIAAGSLALSVWLSPTHPAAMFLLAPARAVELLTGAAVALNKSTLVASRRFRETISAIAVVAILLPLFLFTVDTPFPSFRAMLPCLGTALVLTTAQTTMTARCLSIAPLVFAGDISYSLYLWHWPILVICRRFTVGNIDAPRALICIALAFVLATLCWRYVESPALRISLSHARWFSFYAAGSFCLLCVGIGLAYTKGLPRRFSPPAQAAFAAASDFNPQRKLCHQYGASEITYAHACTFGDPATTPHAAVWADSHGAELVVALGERLAAQHSSIKQLTASGCPPSLDFAFPMRPWCAAHNSNVINALTAHPEIHIVYLAANYLGYHSSLRPQLLSGIRQSVLRLRRAGKEVVLLEQVPPMPFDAPNAIGLLLADSKPTARFGITIAYYNALSSWANNAVSDLARDTGSSLLRPQDAFCGSNSLCAAYSPADQTVFYFDDEHLSVAGARYLLTKAGEHSGHRSE